MRKGLIETLMQRDKLTREEAEALVEEEKEAIMELIEEGRFLDAEATFCADLGLEPDYLEDLLF